MATFMSLDPDTLQQLLDTIRRFVRERLVPLEADVSENDTVPQEVIAEMRELGLFGLSIPEEYGGLGLSMYEEVLAVQELCWTSPAFRSVFGTNVGIGKDHTIFATTEGKVAFTRKAGGRVFVSVAPAA